MVSILVCQVVLVALGFISLVRMLKNESRSLDPVTVAVGLVAATQMNITWARSRYGATINYFKDVPDWTASNFVGAACLLFLIVVLFKTKRRI